MSLRFRPNRPNMGGNLEVLVPFPSGPRMRLSKSVTLTGQWSFPSRTPAVTFYGRAHGRVALCVRCSHPTGDEVG